MGHLDAANQIENILATLTHAKCTTQNKYRAYFQFFFSLPVGHLDAANQVEDILAPLKHMISQRLSSSSSSSSASKLLEPLPYAGVCVRFVRESVRGCVCVCVCMYVFMRVLACTYIYTHTHTSNGKGRGGAKNVYACTLASPLYFLPLLFIFLFFCE